MDSKIIIDQAGNPISMAGRLGADGIFRPVHHSDVITIQTEITRPADTTSYLAGDAIGTSGSGVMSFDIGALGLKAGLIVGASLVRDKVTNSGVRFRASIHDAAINTAPAADNAPAPMLYANRVTRRGWVDFFVSTAGVAAGSNALEYAGVLSNAQGIVVAPSAGILYLSLITLDAFTPESAGKFMIELDIVV